MSFSGQVHFGYMSHDQVVYLDYVRYCEHVGVKPLEFTNWMVVRRSMGSYYNNLAN